MITDLLYGMRIMSNLAVITARCGSQGLKDKNIKILRDRPMLAYTIEAAINSGMFECVHVSTDSSMYADIGKLYGADVPFLRDKVLASDTASSWDVVRDVINKYLMRGKIFDTVTLLQPTSPLRTEHDIRKAFSIFNQKGADSVISVCETDCFPVWCNTLDTNQSMENFVDSKYQVPRQQLPKIYHINGAIYIQKVKLLMDGSSLYGKKSYAYIMDKKHSIDVDDEFDFVIAEYILDRILDEEKISGRKI